MNRLLLRLFNIQIASIHRKRFTFLMNYMNFNTKEFRTVYVQFSLTKPWLLPKYDPTFGKCHMPLYGWLFFYFGAKTEGYLYRIKDGIITDKYGNTYYAQSFKNDEGQIYHRKIKHGAKFSEILEYHEDGTYDITVQEIEERILL